MGVGAGVRARGVTRGMTSERVRGVRSGTEHAPDACGATTALCGDGGSRRLAACVYDRVCVRGGSGMRRSRCFERRDRPEATGTGEAGGRVRSLGSDSVLTSRRSHALSSSASPGRPRPLCTATRRKGHRSMRREPPPQRFAERSCPCVHHGRMGNRQTPARLLTLFESNTRGVSAVC